MLVQKLRTKNALKALLFQNIFGVRARVWGPTWYLEVLCGTGDKTRLSYVLYLHTLLAYLQVLKIKTAHV